MAGFAYDIAGLDLEPQKREFKVRANKKVARAGDVIKFTITATGVTDRTVRSYYLSNNFGPEDIAVGVGFRGIWYIIVDDVGYF